MKRRILSIVLTIAMLMGTFAFPAGAVAADGTLSVTVGDVVDGQVEVSVDYTGNPGIAGLDFVLDFDETKLKPVSYEYYNMFMSGMYQGNFIVIYDEAEENEVDPDYSDETEISYVYVNSKNSKKNGTLFTVVFELVDGEWDETPLTIGSLEASNKDYVTLNPDVVNGKVEKPVIPEVEFTFEDDTVIYDGQVHSLVATNLPDGASVVYENNGKIDAGTYEVTATVSCDGYKSTTKTATLTIEKRNVSIIDLKAEDKTYDGTDKAYLSYERLEASDENGTTGIVFPDEVELLLPLDASFATANAGTDIEVTYSDFALVGAVADNYKLVYPSSLKADIVPQPITVKAINTSKVQGEDDPELTYEIIEGELYGTDAFEGVLTRESGEDPKRVYRILQGTLSLSDNYDLRFEEGVFTITEKIFLTQNVQVSEITDKVYGDSFKVEVTPDAQSGLSDVVYSSTDEDVATIDQNGNVTIHNTGKTTIKVTIEGNNDYKTFTNRQTLRVTKREITVTFDNKTKNAKENDPELTYKITQGSLVNGDAFEGEPARDSGETAGEYEIWEGSLSLSNNYDVTYIPGTLTINKIKQNVSVSDIENKTYGDGSFEIDVTPDMNSGLTNVVVTSTNTGVATVEGKTVTIKNAGDAQIKIEIAGDGYYEDFETTLDFNVEKANLSLSGFIAQDKVYDGNTKATLSYKELSGLVDGDEITVKLPTDAKFEDANAGKEKKVTFGTVTLSGTALKNYTFTQPDSVYADITPRDITVTVNNATKKVGETDPAFTYSVTSGKLVSGDAFTGSVERTPGENAGTYEIGKGTLSLSDNYNLTVIPGTFTITKTLQKVAVSEISDKTYGDDSFKVEVTPDALSNIQDVTFESTNKNVATVDANGLVTIVGAGVADITVNVAGNNDFEPFTKTQTLKVLPREITVTVADATKNAKENDPELTYKVTSGSLVNNDSFTGAISRVEGEKAGTYQINKGTLALNDNYVLTVIPGTFTINKIDQNVVVADIEGKTYGDEAFEIDVTPDAQSGLSDVVVTSTKTSVATVSGKVVAIKGAGQTQIKIEIAGDDYYNDFEETLDLTVEKKPISLSGFKAESKEYDGNTKATLSYDKLEGLVNGDRVTVRLPSDAQFEDKNAGTNKLVTFSDVEFGGTAFKNYTFTQPGSLYADITKRDITVTIDDKTKRVGTDDPDFTYTITSGQLVRGDAFTGALAREAGEEVGGEYAITKGTLALSDNYNLTVIPGTLTVIEKNVQNVVVSEVTNKTYGDAGFKVTVTPDSQSGLRTVVYTSTNTDVAEIDRYGNVTIKNAGTTEIKVAIAGNDNYADFEKVQTLEVLKRNVTVTIDNHSKDALDIDPELSYEITSGSLVNGDTFTGEPQRAQGETGGTYAITKGTLALNDNYNLTVIEGTFTINKLDQDVEVEPVENKTYGDEAFEIEVRPDAHSGLSGVVITSLNTDVVTVNGNVATIVGSGSAQIKVAVSGNGYFNDFEKTLGFEVAKKRLTLSGFKAENKEYDGTANATLSYNELSGAVEADNVTVNIPDAFFADANVGRNKTVTFDAITLSGSNLENYEFAAPTSAKANITAREITVTVDSKTKRVGTQDPEFTYRIESGSLVDGDAFTGELTRRSGEAADKEYPITKGTLALSSNYKLTVIPGTLYIAAKEVQDITVTPENAEFIYGDDGFTVTVSGNITTPVFASSNENVVTVTQDGVVTVVGAGNANIIVVCPENEEYAKTPEIAIPVTVNKKIITVTDVNFDDNTLVSDDIKDGDTLYIDLANLKITVGADNGDNSDVTVEEIALEGENANYKLSESQGAIQTTVTNDKIIEVAFATFQNGSADGDGRYLIGTTVTVKATANNRYYFTGWYKGVSKVSTNETYTFTASEDVTLTAKFAKVTTGGGGGLPPFIGGNTEPKEDPAKKQIVLYIDQLEAKVFGEKVYNDVAPIIVNGRTMLPARFVAESLGAKVEWDNALRKVTITKDTTVIEIYIDSDIAYVNGVQQKLDSPAFIRNDRTYTPLRFIVEALEEKIEWDDILRKVTITKVSK